MEVRNRRGTQTRMPGGVEGRWLRPPPIRLEKHRKVLTSTTEWSH